MDLETMFPSYPVDELLSCWLAGDHLVAHGAPARLTMHVDLPHTLEELLPRAAYHCTLSAFTATPAGDLAPLHGLTPAQAVQLHRAGHSIQFAEAQRCPELQAAGAALARQFGVPTSSVTTRIIVSPPGAPDAYGWHFDTATVIAVQLGGSKSWQLAGNDDVRFPHRAGHPTQPVRGPLNALPGFSPRGYGPAAFDTTPFARAEHVRLTAGSVLLNPGGRWHRTTDVGPEGSCSVSFLFEPDSWMKVVVRGLVAVLVQDAGWRAPALGLTAPGSARARARVILADQLVRLSATVAQLDIDELLERAHDSHLAHLPPSGAHYRLAADSTAALARHADDRWYLTTADDVIELAESLVPVCQWILATDGVPFSTSAVLLATTPAPHELLAPDLEPTLALLDVLESLGLVERARGAGPS